MEIELASKDPEALVPTPLLQQTPFWGRLKGRLGWEPRAFDFSLPSEKGDVLVTLRRVAEDATIAYVPYGPELAPAEDERGAFLEDLSETLRADLGPECLFIRWDLPWESPYAADPSRYDEDGRWEGRPDPRSRELRMNFGTARRALRKAGTDVLPPDTLVVDLRGTEDEILARMKPKSRYNVRLAARSGVLVREGSRADLAAWNVLYGETCRRNGIRHHGPEYFSALLDSVGPGCGAAVRLLVAEVEGRPAAMLFLAVSGDAATYLYGASAYELRSFMAPYALQWEAMKLAKRAGCSTYDLFGCAGSEEPSHPMHGLYRFKTGFGGDFLHRQGCWDYPLDPAAYAAYSAREAAEEGFHLA